MIRCNDFQSFKTFKVSQFEGFWLEATVAHIIAASLCVCEFIGWMAAAKFPSNMGFNVCNHDMSYWILAWVGLASNLLLCLYRVRASVRVIENIEFQITLAKSEASLILKDKFSSLGPRYINANPKSHVQSDERIEIADMKFISGACMFFKTETFKSLEGFDENFFLYFEESDFCLRSYKINKNYWVRQSILG